MHLNPYINTVLEHAQATPPQALYALARNLFTAWQEEHTVFTCGNGGSYSNAQHLAQDLEKGTQVAGCEPLKAYHLGANPSALTAWANDDGYATVFSADLEAHGRQGDILIAISGSGNSPNILNAVHMAHELEMRTWGVTGFDGGDLLETAHRCVHVPLGNMGMVEAVHGILFHWLVDYLHEAFVTSTYRRLDEWAFRAPEAVR